MMGRILRDLTLSDFTFGAGPLVLAILALIRAGRVDAAFDRWAWIACGVIMLAVCVAYLTWAWRRRAQLKEDVR